MPASTSTVQTAAAATAQPATLPVAAAAERAPAFSPLYQQIKSLIMRALQGGEWKPGEVIPSEQELALRFKVSQGTVRKAIDELATENLLVRRQGKGTFVATHAEQKTQFRFLRLRPDEAQLGGMSRRVLDCRRLRATGDIAKALALPKNAPVILIQRVLSFQDKPVVLDEIWLPGGLFKGLTVERLTQYRGPMYALFETEFGVHMARAEERIKAVAADATRAGLLGVPAGSPLLSVERTSFTYGDKPVELRRGLYDTSRHYYRNELL